MDHVVPPTAGSIARQGDPPDNESLVRWTVPRAGVAGALVALAAGSFGGALVLAGAATGERRVSWWAVAGIAVLGLALLVVAVRLQRAVDVCLDETVDDGD
jgi:LPXTG-motif cell wall-anchored protein